MKYKKEINVLISLIIAAVVIFLLFGCGTRKRAMQKTVSELSVKEKKDVFKKEIIKTETNFAIIKKSNKLSYKPIDANKPMIINDQKYFNTEIESETKSEVDTTKSAETKEILDIDKTETDKDLKELNKQVNVERDFSLSFWDWFYLAASVAGLALLYFKRKKILSFFI